MKKDQQCIAYKTGRPYIRALFLKATFAASLITACACEWFAEYIYSYFDSGSNCWYGEYEIWEYRNNEWYYWGNESIEEYCFDMDYETAITCGCGGTSSGTCPPNKFTVHDGNAHREVREFRIPGRGLDTLTWARHHNTVERDGMLYFGIGGGWRHEWQYDLQQLNIDQHGFTGIGIIFPDGDRRIFEEHSGEFISEARPWDKLTRVGEKYILQLGSGDRFSFEPVAALEALSQYEMRSITHVNGQKTLLSYNSNGLLDIVQTPSGKWIKLHYTDISFTYGDWQVVKRLDEGTAGHSFVVDRRVSEGEVQYVRIRGGEGSKIAVSEIDVKDPYGTRIPITVKGTGGSTAALVDGNIETGFEGERSSANAVWILVPPGPFSSYEVSIRSDGRRDLAEDGLKIELFAAQSRTRSVLSRVEASNGYSVDYHYEKLHDPLTQHEYIVLSRASYPDSEEAAYQYEFVRAYGRPQLVEAVDPYYVGEAKQIRYSFHDKQGMIHKEINPVTGQVYAALEVDPNNPERRIVTYSDRKKILFETPTELGGRPTMMIDALGRKTQYQYEDRRDGRKIVKSDHLGNRTEIAINGRGMVTSVKVNDLPTKVVNYTDDGWQTTKFDDLGNAHVYKYNNFNQLVKYSSPLSPARMFVYDDLGRVTEYGSENSARTVFKYDSGGLLREVITAHGDQYSLEYDSLGRNTAVSNKEGRRRSRELSYRGLPIVETTANGAVMRKSYDRFGREKHRIDSSGVEERWEHDELGRVTMHVTRSGKRLLYEYDESSSDCSSCGRFAESVNIIDDSGKEYKLVRDPIGRLVSQSIIDRDGVVTSLNYEYNEQNKVTKVTSSLSDVTLYNYDASGKRLVEIVRNPGPSGESIAIDYNPLGQIIGVTDPLGNKTAFARDLIGNITEQIAPDGGVTFRTFNAKGQVTAMMLPSGTRVENVYSDSGVLVSSTIDDALVYKASVSSFGELISVSDGREVTYEVVNDRYLRSIKYPDGRKESGYLSDDHRQIVTQKRSGATITTELDGSGRPIKRAAANLYDTQTESFTYDKRGNLSRIDNSIVDIAYEYDTDGRVVAETFDFSAIAPRVARQTVRYRYDTSRGGRTLVYPNGVSVRTVQSPLGRVKDVIRNGRLLLELGYDRGGRHSAVTRANGSHSLINYDSMSRIARIEHTSLGAGVGWSYRYSLTGLRTHMNSEVDGDVAIAYDSKGQIVEVASSDRKGLNIGRALYEYDKSGNRIRVLQDGRQILYENNSMNQYVGVKGDGVESVLEYDRDGNLISDGFNSYTYDIMDRLVSVLFMDNGRRLRKVRMYDGLGRCVATNTDELVNGQWQNIGQRFTLFEGWSPIADIDGDGRLVAEYIYSDEVDRILAYVYNDRIYYPLTDALGSVRALEDSAGVVVGTCNYDVFGNRIGASGIMAEGSFRFGYTGREEIVSKVWDYRNRAYDSALGRFMQLDPIRFHGGDLNLYRYVLNSPATFRDPTGLYLAFAGGADQPAIIRMISCLITSSTYSNIWSLLAGDSTYWYAGTYAGSGALGYFTSHVGQHGSGYVIAINNSYMRKTLSGQNVTMVDTMAHEVGHAKQTYSEGYSAMQAAVNTTSTNTALAPNMAELYAELFRLEVAGQCGYTARANYYDALSYDFVIPPVVAPCDCPQN